ASQLAETLGQAWALESGTGTWLRTHLFAPGARFVWSELIRRVTGKPLSPEPFARQFVHMA
ncbi:MAG TPA: hypothetical protein VF234_01365, partial [Limnochordia bacterium]